MSFDAFEEEDSTFDDWDVRIRPSFHFSMLLILILAMNMAMSWAYSPPSPS
jgi:hypothetical protein